MISASFNQFINKKSIWPHFILTSLLFNLLVHLIIGLIYYNPIDFVLQFEASREIANGKLLYRDIGEIIINENIRLPRPQYPPLYLYTLAFFILLFGIDLFTWQMAKIFLISFNIIVGLLVTYIILIYNYQHPKRDLLALLTLNWFLLNPISLGVIFGGYHEYFMIFFVVIAFIMFKKQYYLISGIFFGFSLLVKPITGIYMFPLVIWSIQQKDWKTAMIFPLAGLTFLVGSLPFILLAPAQYLNDVFLIHTKRPDPSMSLYTYFLTEISTTAIPFIIQSVILGICLLFFIKKIQLKTSKDVIESVLPFMTIFLTLNRILYPHYMPFFFPFYSISLFLVISEIFGVERKSYYMNSLLGLILGLFLVYVGDFWWSYLWTIEGYRTYLVNPFFPLSAIICIFGLILISSFSIRLLYLKNNKMKEKVI